MIPSSTSQRHTSQHKHNNDHHHVHTTQESLSELSLDDTGEDYLDSLSAVSSDYGSLASLSQSSASEHHALLMSSTRNVVAHNFNELPNEILVHILIFLNGAQILKLEILSKKFYQLIHHEDESERQYNKKIRRKRILTKEKRKEQRRLSINLATTIASSGLDLHSITSGYEFWIFLNEVHFKEETQRRRKEYPSAIQPRIFYMYHLKVAWLNEKYGIEKALRSLEDALTSHPYFNEVCIFSPHLLRLYYLLYLIDRDYATMDLRYHPFEELKLDVEKHVTPIAKHVMEKDIMRVGQGSMKMIAIVKLSPKDVLRNVQPGQQESLTQEQMAQQILLEAYSDKDFRDDRDVSMVKFIHEMNPSSHANYRYQLDEEDVGDKAGKITNTLNAIYRSWYAKWRDVINKNRDYQSFKSYDFRELETIKINSGFTYDNGLRCANSWIKRDYVYTKLLQRQLH
ncbi:hypothetical protein FDP41_001248 [Naegleria fowleri]|uniref:F-box domain-containing protein n=1 Tax=Naegleria fowleri TaxID=5763 RepID=A0A6A5C148_NAEFO|nr:uncharacterized protein FDP41_001248 [Naegleria fowleri]KAF0979580.1 hypothetical protein FDP41_001248 [Naegleria fowleri]